jgi:two-component system cell cycle sensor histidine kinase/response regulator CckA
MGRTSPSLVVMANKLILLVTAMVLLGVPLATEDIRPILSGLPFLVLYGYGWRTASNGNEARGAWAFIIGTWLLQVSVVCLIPNMDAQALVSSVNLVLAAGFMLGRTQAVMTSLACGSSIIGIYTLRVLGLAPVPILPPNSPVVEMSVVVATLLATGGLTFIGIKHMTNAIEAAEKSRNETSKAMLALETSLYKDTRRAWRQERLGVMARSLVGLREPAAITHEVTVGVREALSVDVALAVGRGGQVVSLVGLGELDISQVVFDDGLNHLFASDSCTAIPTETLEYLSTILGIPLPKFGLSTCVPHSSIVLIVICLEEGHVDLTDAWPLEVAANLHGAATHRLLSEQRVVQADKMEAIGRLSAGIAHDFNNLLTSVVGGAEIIEHKLGPGHIVEAQVQGIREAGERAAALTSKLMSFTRGTPRLPHPVNPVGVVEDLIPILRRSVEENISIETHLEEDGLWVSADPIDLERIVLNLVLNARDALGGTGRVDVGVEARCSREGQTQPADNIVIWVQDDGEGMDLGTRTRVFEPFFTTRKNKGSTGLGLSIVYGVVESLGGNIFVDSTLGKGTCFDVVLPRLWNPVLPEPVVPVTLGSQGGAKVLVVEDDPDVRLTLCEMLQLGGFEVVPVGSGQEALDLLNLDTEAIDLVLSDVVMPGMGGFELADNLKAQGLTVPLAFISGYAAGQATRNDSDMRHPFISKPFSLVELLEFTQLQLVRDPE